MTSENYIEKLELENFGPFGSVDMELSPAVNIILGDNGVGKTQLLKVLYSTLTAITEKPKVLPDLNVEVPQEVSLNKQKLSHDLAKSLVDVFRPSGKKLGRLALRSPGRSASTVGVKLSSMSRPLKYYFSTKDFDVVDISSMPKGKIVGSLIFFPAQELLSFGASLASLYDNMDIPIDRTWVDTIKLLLIPPSRGPRADNAKPLYEPISRLLGGATVVEEGGEFFLKRKRGGNIESALLAEGHRKLASLMRLIANGTLLDGSILFWDEPEANLNLHAQKMVAKMIVTLGKSGVQIVLSTHSLYLIRQIALESDDNDFKLFNFKADDKGRSYLAGQGKRHTELGEVELINRESDQALEILGAQL